MCSLNSTSRLRRQFCFSSPRIAFVRILRTVCDTAHATSMYVVLLARALHPRVAMCVFVCFIVISRLLLLFFFVTVTEMRQSIDRSRAKAAAPDSPTRLFICGRDVILSGKYMYSSHRHHFRTYVSYVSTLRLYNKLVVTDHLLRNCCCEDRSDTSLSLLDLLKILRIFRFRHARRRDLTLHSFSVLFENSCHWCPKHLIHTYCLSQRNHNSLPAMLLMLLTA